MRLSTYVKIYPHKEDPDYLLFYSTKKASKVLLHKTILRSIEQGDISPSDAEPLTSLGFLVPDPEEEKKEMLGILDEANRRSRKFTAIVVMNLDCNLACRYCYEGGMKGKFYMSSETANQLADFIERNHLAGGKNVEIDFYGGEPLLSFGLIKDISSRLKSAADSRGLEFTFTLVTNGTLLTAEKVVELTPLGLKGARITLDGPRENHNIFRPFKSGAGAFDIIIQNIKEVCGLTGIQIGGNYTRENYGEFPRLLDYLIREGLTPGKIRMVKFDPVTRPGGEFALPDFSEGSESINEPWLFEASMFLREEVLKRGFDTFKIFPSPCMVELHNNIVSHYDGTLYKCPGMIGMKGLDVGGLRTGIKDFRVALDTDLWKNDECLECAYLPICFGGCRYMRLLRDGKTGIDCRKPYLDATLEAMIKQDITYRRKG